MSDTHNIVNTLNNLKDNEIELAHYVLEQRIKAARANQKKKSVTKNVLNRFAKFIDVIHSCYKKAVIKSKILIYGDPPTPLKIKMQRLAGITPKAVARLHIDETKQIDLEFTPSAWKILKFRICGFRYEMLHDFEE